MHVLFFILRSVEMNGSTAKGNARCTSGCGLWGETALAYSDKRHAALIWNERFIGNQLRLIRGEPVSRALFEVFNLVYQSTTPRQDTCCHEACLFSEHTSA